MAPAVVPPGPLQRLLTLQLAADGVRLALVRVLDLAPAVLAGTRVERDVQDAVDDEGVRRAEGEHPPLEFHALPTGELVPLDADFRADGLHGHLLSFEGKLPRLW